MQRFLSLSMGPFRFLDSLHFLKGSLSKLVENIHNGGHSFPLLRDLKWKKLSGVEHRDYCLRKGVYPYRTALSAEQLRAEERLPPEKDFYSDLTEEHVCDDDYAFAQRFWAVSGCKTMLDYTEAYCILDVVLLASCMEHYRSQVYAEFKLDPSQFLSGPHLAFNAMLLLLKDRVDLLTDFDMFEMLENGLRGGVSHAALRHAKVDSSDASDTLIMLDAVNLYGWSLCQKLPAHSFQWLSEEEIASVDWTSFQQDGDDESDTGYILEVDLEYPQELHEAHCSFPLAPQQLTITEDMLSPYANHCRNIFASAAGSARTTFVPEKKLCGTFFDRKKYVIHYRCLSLYLSLGMKLSKIHRAISFRQSSWIADYVKNMTAKRQAATSKFDQQTYKDFINHIFGKCIQNLRKQLVCHFCTSQEQWQRLDTSHAFEKMRPVSEDCVVFYSKKKEILMDRPYFAGFAVLELSKLLMYRLFYREIKPRFPTSYVCFTDTDSLMIFARGVRKETFLKDMSPCMDFSNYPPSDAHYTLARKMVPGLLKDETSGRQVTELVALKSKCYAFKTEDDALNAKCKGAKKSIIKRDMRLDMYKSCLTSINKLRIASSRLQSRDYKMYLLRTRKVALSSYESKRYVWPCGIHSHPYGSWQVLQGITTCPHCHVSVEEMKCKLVRYNDYDEDE